MKKSFLLLIAVVFVIMTAVLYALCTANTNLDRLAILAANAIMALLSVASYFLVKNQMKNTAQAFVTGVSSSSFLKLIVCGGGIFLYVLARKPHVDKPSIFVMFGIYLVYTVMETAHLYTMSKKKA